MPDAPSADVPFIVGVSFLAPPCPSGRSRIVKGELTKYVTGSSGELVKLAEVFGAVALLELDGVPAVVAEVVAPSVVDTVSVLLTEPSNVLVAVLVAPSSLSPQSVSESVAEADEPVTAAALDVGVLDDEPEDVVDEDVAASLEESVGALRRTCDVEEADVDREVSAADTAEASDVVVAIGFADAIDPLAESNSVADVLVMSQSA